LAWVFPYAEREYTMSAADEIVERVARSMATAYVDNELDNVEINPARFADANWRSYADQARAAIAGLRPEIEAARDHIIGSTGARPGSDSAEVVATLQSVLDAAR
jgi:hypothetical protein